MSYLARLVDRAVGPAAAAASPRLAPVFPLGPGRRVDEPLPQSETQERSTGVTAEQANPEAATPATAREAAASGRPRVDVAPPVAAGPAFQPQRTAEPREPAVVMATAEPPPTSERQLPEPHAVTVEAVREPEPRPPVADVRVEQHTERLDRLTIERRSTAAAASRSHRAPRIDVRIGRVEVHRPPDPEPPAWPDRAPAVAEPSAIAGFADLAAARRYVDRSWS